MNLVIFIDGAARGNPGPASAGVVIHDHDTDTLLHEAGYFLGKATNNDAEYQSLVRALQLAEQLGAEDLSIHSDSELMVRQINGEYKVKSPGLQRRHKEVMVLLNKVSGWQIEHIGREQNTRADRAANKALDAGRDVVVESCQPFINASPAPTGAHRCAVPSWSARLIDSPGPQCPAAMDSGTRFTFGPCTPDGLCVYAAQAAIAHSPIGSKPPASARCSHCNARIQIKRL